MADEQNEIEETEVEAAVEETEAVDAGAEEASAASGDAAEASDATGDADAPKRRRRGRSSKSESEPVETTPGEPVRVRAQAKYVRSSARKARLVCDHIRGKSVDEARALLATHPRSVSQDWSKVLESAIANAEHNNGLEAEDLRIVAIAADEGPTLKRFRPRAMGRATSIRKRTSHLTIVLGTEEQ